MKAFKEFIEQKHDEVRHLFEKGGKYERMYPLFEAQDTFMLTPPDTTKGTTHIRDAVDLKRVMITVVIALLPCLLWSMYNAGYNYFSYSGVDASPIQVLFKGIQIVMPIVLVSYVVGGLWEVLFCVVRKPEINEGFLVTGMLFPLTLPPTIPLWEVAVGITFGIVIGKEIFGGTGFNILNPALTARAYLFFAHAKDMTGDIWVKTVDGVTGATPLGIAAEAGAAHQPVTEVLAERNFTFASMFLGLEPGSLGETSLIPILLGAAILIITGIGSWSIMLSGCAGLAFAGIVMNFIPTETGGALLSTYTQVPFYYHFVMGSFAFGIVFMATDPVSAAMTNRGKWIYGFLIGVVTIMVRVTNPGFPEGVMLAILLMNVLAPYIDTLVVDAHIKKRNAYLRKFSYAKG